MNCECGSAINSVARDMVGTRQPCGHTGGWPAKKTLHNTTANGASKNVKDIQFWGNGDSFKLISKASSEAEGWMKSTKAMEIPGVGCVVQVTTQQRNPDGSYAVAEAVTFVPGATIHEDCAPDPSKPENGMVLGRRLIKA